MITNIQAIMLSVVILMYYTYVLVIHPITKIGTLYNTPNANVNKLRRDYKVKIQTFKKNNLHWGYVGFKTIYLNERLFKTKKRLEEVFFHEYYHYIKRHHQKYLLMRLFISLVPLLLIFVNQYIVLVIFITSLLVAHNYKENIFEKKANQYADEQTPR